MVFRTRACVLSVLVLLAVALPGFSQGRRMRGTQPTGSAPGVNVPPAVFTGSVETINKGSLTLEQDGANSLRFICSHKTHYFDGDKKIKLADIKPGIRVSVESKRYADGEMEAINVRIEPAAAPKPANPKTS
jgi:hypothetical protein